MLGRRGGRESGNVDSRLPETTERSKVHCIGGVVTMHDPCIVFFGKEAGTMKDVDADVNDVVVGDLILGKIEECGTRKVARDKELKTLGGMPLKGHRSLIGGAILSRRAVVLVDEPRKQLAKNRVRVLHADLLV